MIETPRSESSLLDPYLAAMASCADMPASIEYDNCLIFKIGETISEEQMANERSVFLILSVIAVLVIVFFRYVTHKRKQSSGVTTPVEPGRIIQFRPKRSI